MITQFCGIVPLTGVIKSTTESMQLYVDGSVGDDANNGLSPVTPKKTFEAIFGMLPFFVYDNVTINCSGVFSEFGINYINKYVLRGKNLVIDGGSALTVVDDNGGSNYTITGSSTNYITVSGASWPVDGSYGLLIEILTGPQAGRLRMIQGNTTDTLTPVKNFAGNPGVGSTFRIVRYATTIQASSTYTFLIMSFVGGGSVHFQRFSTLGSRVYLEESFSEVGMLFRACTFLSTYAYSLQIADSLRGGTTGSYMDPITYGTNSTDYTGVSSPNAQVVVRTCDSLSLNAFCGDDLQVTNTGLLYGGRDGTRSKSGAMFTSCKTRSELATNIYTRSGYATTKFSNTTGIGLTFESCDKLKVSGIDVSNCGSHAVELKSSYIELTGAITGTGNVGAGVREQLGSQMTIKNGSPPTITGTVGDLSFDGTTQASTWAAIDAGTPASDTTEMSMCKEV